MFDSSALLLILSLAAPAFSASSKVDSDDVRRLQLLKTPDLLIIDVRSPSDYAAGHIQGAKNIPAFDFNATALPKDARLAVYCPNPACPQGKAVADKLIGMGFPRVSVLEGGFAEWTKKGYPVEKTRPRAKPQAATIFASEAQKRLQEFRVLDVRPAQEFSAGHLPGAVNSPLETLEPSRIPKGVQVLVYDRLSTRSRKAAEKLIEAGYSCVELAGGFAGWARKKYPVEVK